MHFKIDSTNEKNRQNDEGNFIMILIKRLMIITEPENYVINSFNDFFMQKKIIK